MATSKTVTRIIEVLRDTNLPWLLPNLRQDFVVWNALLDPGFIDKLIQTSPSAPKDFAPASLALLALDHPALLPSELETSKISNTEPIIQLAIQSVEGRAALGAAAQDLASSGLVALTWLNKNQATHSWQALLDATRETPQREWPAAIACLFGMLDQPVELLRSLLKPGASSFQVSLAVHAILSNPLSTDEQIALVGDLCQGTAGDPLPAAERIQLISTLAEQCPQIAEKFSVKWLDTHPEYSIQGVTNPKNIAALVSQLLENTFQAELRRLAGGQNSPISLLEDQLEITRLIYGDFTNHYLAQLSGQAGEKHFTRDISGVLEESIKLNALLLPKNAHPANQAGLALFLAERGQPDEAMSIIASLEAGHPDDVESLYAIAKIYALSGDPSLAWKALSRIIELLEQKSKTFETVIWGDGFSLVNLGNLLLQINRPSEAVGIFERALKVCPNDAGLLQMTAGSCKRARQGQKTAAILNTLVALYPADLNYRRDYAKSLEELAEWETGLDQRRVIIALIQEQSIPCPISDKYAYVRCAIEANEPEIAIQVCEELLGGNSEDVQALIYSGQAYMLMGTSDRGLEILARATQLSPTSEEAWIALAQAHEDVSPLPLVIETLQNASRSVPGSAQIHYLLGDYYLQANELSQAMTELQDSVELSPDTPQFLVRYAEALHLCGQTGQSREIFGKAYRLEPGFPGLAEIYANILLGLGELEAAIAPLETLINSKTMHGTGPYMDYARCILALHKQGLKGFSPMKALIALNAVLQIDPQNAEAKALTAEALTANGENELAFQAYREALDTPLTEDKAWFERLSFGFGCVASSIGKQDIAIAALQEASQVNPNNPAIFISLSEAYLSANLAEDALRTARNVLAIDGENPDQLAWFAHQVARLNGGKKLETFSSTTSFSKDITNEALSALSKAIFLAPRRTDLLVQLGLFQASIGEADEARATFASISGLDFATIDDLVTASKYLGDHGDHPSAISCLEKSILNNHNSGEKPDPGLFASLAQEYVKNHDHASAINALDAAIAKIPDESSLISLKVDILLGLGQPLDALNVIEAALQQNIDPTISIDLLLLASRIKRCMGDIPSAINHAWMSISSSVKNYPGAGIQQLPPKHLAYLADIYRALLQPGQAFNILKATKCSQADFANEQDYLDYIFLHTELALETGERIYPDIKDIKLETDHAYFSRWMAINARLMNKAGNYKQAVQLFQIAYSKLENPEVAIEQPAWSIPYTTHLNLVAVLESAQDLGLWDQAMACAQKAALSAVGEPLSQLNIAKILVLRAEFNQLCELFEVTQHLPTTNSYPGEDYDLSQSYLEQSRACLETYQDLASIDGWGITGNEINRWDTRARIIFNRVNAADNNPEEILGQLSTPGDTVALIHHLHKGSQVSVNNNALPQIIKLARAYPRNPAVILRVALALQNDNPQDALKALQAMLEHNPYSRIPSIAFCNILLARIGNSLGDYAAAQEAVEKALAIWPDEASWHYLAAQIYQHCNDVHNATQHLLEAANLAATNITYHIELGRLFFESAADDVGELHQALASFENAIRLEPNNIAVQVQLANTHYRLNNLDQAETHARSALAIEPEQAELYQLLSKIAIEKNDFQGAYEYASKATQMSPQDFESTLMLSRALSAMGRHNEALDKLDLLIPLVEDGRQLQLERVKITRKVSGLQIALTQLKALAKNYPDDFTMLSALSKSYFEAGELENAVGAAQQALSAEGSRAAANEQANMHLLIGQVFRQQGLLDQSIHHLNDAIRLAPNRLEPYLELGLARKEGREYQQALQIFEQAAVIAPNDPRALFQAGLALKESKDYKSSETMLRRAVSLAPNDLAIRRQLAAVVALNLIHNPRSARSSAK